MEKDEELQALKQENEILKCNEYLRSLITAKDNELHDLRQKNEALKINIHELGYNLTEKERQLDVLSQENESLKKSKYTFGFDFGQKQKQLDTLRQEYEGLKLKYHKSREELQDSQHEFQDFKQRMGKVVDLTLGTSGVLSEDITNPCRESELRDMYKKLSKNDWAKFLRQLKKGVPETAGQSKELRKLAEERIKVVLRQSQEDIEKIMNKMKRFVKSRQEQPENTKPAQYFDLAIQKFQMAIFQKKNGCYNTDELQDIPDVLRPMIEECYKTGCLMALHNPPLLLDFDNSGQGLFPPIKNDEIRKSEPFSSSVDPPENSVQPPLDNHPEEPQEPTLVIAIDFGTSFSGFCFKMCSEESVQKFEWRREDGCYTPKTRTCILFDEKEKFLKFGYDAVMTYAKQIRSKEGKELYLFENFKKGLYGQELHRDFMITAKNGKQMKAMKVFSESLRFMKLHALEMIGKHTSGVKHSASDAMWILTVPTLWSAAAKQFMREAATEAGLVKETEPDRLIIALEAEVASVWCRQLPSEDFMEGALRGAEKIKDVPGTQYMVVDCGGGSVDITVHEMMKGGGLEELYGNNMNGLEVDENIKAVLRELVDEGFSVIDKEHRSKLQKLLYDCNGELHCFYNTRSGYLQELFRKVKDTGAYGREITDWVQKLESKVESIYDDSLRRLESLIKDAVKKPNLNISYIFLVGGFALSSHVNSLVRERFGGWCKVLCPVDAQMAVLYGAVRFGMIPNVVLSRISQFTYGIGIMEVFDQTKHKGKRTYVTKDGVVFCDVCFYCLVKKDESVCFDEVREFDFSLLEKKQKSVKFNFYYTESQTARFVDEQGMVKIGSLTVSMPVIKVGSPRSLKLQVKFGCPEMQVTATDVDSGETSSVKLDITSK